MKKTIFSGLAVVSLAFSSLAGTPSYSTLAANGNAAAPASVVIPADPTSQIRVLTLFYTSDTNNAILSMSTASGAYYQAATNALSSSITNSVNSTNGLLNGSIMVLQQNGVDYTNTLASYTNFPTANASGVLTNNCFIVLAAGGWGVAANIGSDIYQMGSPLTAGIGAGTNSMSGEAIFVGNFGRPVQVTLAPALVTNRLSSIGVHYDHQ